MKRNERKLKKGFDFVKNFEKVKMEAIDWKMRNSEIEEKC